MTKRETFSLMSMIFTYYEQFELDQKKVDSWHKVLKGYSFEQLEENLLSYVTESPYPPKISDLIRKPAAISRIVPDTADTTHILKFSSKPASEEVVQTELAKMRAILGIKRGDSE